MSILIKGMEMPEAGEHILSLYVYHDGTATVIGQHRHYEKEPFEAIPIPLHGKLIDADADMRPTKHGKWTLNKDGSGTCSECRRTQKNCWDLDNWDNFCHFCGADMREKS